MPCKKLTPDELMEQAMWTKTDIARIFRRDPKTIDHFITHLDPKKRLKGYVINGQFMAEKRAVLKFFEYKPFRESA